MREGRASAAAGDVPGWMEAHRHEAGPLLAAAVAFARWRAPTRFPGGHEGIRRLARILEDFTFGEENEDTDEERFLEGAGAMLAMLLLAHVGKGRHRERAGVHLIELGDDGFFDPFAAIDAALDAKSPAAELARQVGAAEAEAAGEGPRARVHAALGRALRRHAMPSRVVDRFDAWAALDDGVELELSRFLRLDDPDPSTLDAAMDSLVGMLRGAETEVDADDLAQRLLPRLASRAFVDELQRARGVALAARPYVGELVVALVLAYDGRARFLREGEETRLRARGVDAFALALARLETLAPGSRWRDVRVGSASALEATRADGLAASLLLSARVRETLGERLGHPYVAFVPHRDRLVVCALRDLEPAAMDELRDESSRAPHAISGEPLRIDAAGAEPTPWRPA